MLFSFNKSFFCSLPAHERTRHHQAGACSQGATIEAREREKEGKERSKGGNDEEWPSCFCCWLFLLGGVWKATSEHHSKMRYFPHLEKICVAANNNYTCLFGIEVWPLSFQKLNEPTRQTHSTHTHTPTHSTHPHTQHKHPLNTHSLTHTLSHQVAVIKDG